MKIMSEDQTFNYTSWIAWGLHHLKILALAAEGRYGGQPDAIMKVIRGGI
jgi:hypothetical protein